MFGALGDIGMMSAMASKTRRSSRRARLAPRQTCGPLPPNPRWGLGVRAMSNAVEASNTSSS